MAKYNYRLRYTMVNGEVICINYGPSSRGLQNIIESLAGKEMPVFVHEGCRGARIINMRNVTVFEISQEVRDD